MDQFNKTMLASLGASGLKGDFDEKEIFREPLIFTSFVDACKGHDPSYRGVKDLPEISDVLHSQLEAYNENVAVLDLVLFI
jgi:hypothetical protein